MDSGEPRGEVYRVSKSFLANGPQLLGAIVDELERHGLLDGFGDPLDEEFEEWVTDEILGNSDDIWVDDDMFALTENVVAGTGFTHFVSSEDLTRSMVAVLPDLDVLDLLMPDQLELTGGGSVEVVYPSDATPDADFHGSLRGPPGWLDHLGGPTLAHFARAGNRLFVERVDVVGAGADEIEALRRAAPEHLGGRVGSEVLPIVMSALMHHPGLFRRPVQPVSALMAAAGYECREIWFGEAGTPWMTPSEDARARAKERLVDEDGFAPCCIDAFDVVVEAYLAHARRVEALDAQTRSRVGTALRHGGVGPAVVEYLLGRVPSSSERLERFATTLVEGGAPAEAPAHYLLAMNLERDGEARLAMQHLVDAVTLDPGYAPALAELAWYESDRGNATAAIGLLRRAGMDNDDIDLQFLASLPRQAPASVGRNDPCQCGSGKKFKQCCLNSPNLTMLQRSGWLYHKLEQFVVRPKCQLLLEDALQHAHAHSEEVGTRVAELLLDYIIGQPFVINQFLEERGFLLPEDEREHLELWKSTHRALYEVTARRPGESLTLRESRTGESVVVKEKTASRELAEGTFIFAHVVLVEDANVLIGSLLRISLAQRASLIELLDTDPTPADFGRWLSLAHAPPTLMNREEEFVVVCTLAYQVSDWGVVATALDRIYESREEDGWVELHDLGTEQIVRSFLRRDGQLLRVETNSIERLERVRTQLARSCPSLDLIEESRRNVGDALAEHGGTAKSPPQRDSLHPALERLALEYIEQKEREWVSESIPALGGLTPREALEDPTRREDLLLLLSEFDQRASADSALGAGMDASRLRGLLGLE